MSMMGYTIKTVNNHVEVYDYQNRFVQSADSYDEAIDDMRTDNYEQ